MKILHTSDWHIGKIIHETNLIENQKFVIEEFLKIIDEEGPDVVIIAGDLYDRGVPSKEAVQLLDATFYQLIVIRKIVVIAIAGNHDSAQRLEFASKILEKNQLYIVGKLEKSIQKITIEDHFGNVNFFLMPFAYVSEMRDLLGDEKVASFDDAFKLFTQIIYEGINFNERNILVTHGYFVNLGSELEKADESVRPLSIGTTEIVNVDYLEKFDYVALGHLHKPQKVKQEHIRYAGSLMKYSFSEINHHKSVVLVELGEKSQLKVYLRELKTLFDMKHIQGKFKEIMVNCPSGEVKEAYVLVTLTDETPVYDAISHLKSVYPNILRLEYKSRERSLKVENRSIERLNQRSELELFGDFYLDLTGNNLSDGQLGLAKEVFAEILEHRGDEE